MRRPSLPGPSKILGDLLEFVDRAPPFARQRADYVFQAIIQMILDQRFLGLSDRLLDGLELLRDVEAGPAAFDHLDNAAQMAAGAIQALHNLGMGMVAMIFGHPKYYPLGGDMARHSVDSDAASESPNYRASRSFSLAIAIDRSSWKSTVPTMFSARSSIKTDAV